MKNSTLYILLIITLLLMTSCVVSQQTSKEKKPQAPIPEGTPTATAVFAGGCFWCTESAFEKAFAEDHVLAVVSGYAGGEKEDPTYKEVSSQKTGHLEAVQITYNPEKVSYKDLLNVFWNSIDPTDAGGQFADRGESYTTAIFYKTDDEKKQAEESKAALEQSGKFNKPIITPIIKFTNFYQAEEYHQDYYKKNPIRYNWYWSGSGRKEFFKK